ncbi:MAG: amidohydrolase family protein [Myxococcota bacterium]
MPTLLFASALAADDPKPAWDVNAPHGPTHPVSLEVREGTWMSVTVHGDRVVFDLLGDLWSLPLAGGEAIRLTTGVAWDTQPRFDPDGERLAFASDRGGNEQIWVMNADGTGARQVTDEDEARLTEPMWDGDWIVARKRTVDTRSIGVTELWQYHLEGGKGFQLTSLDAHPHAGEATGDGRFLWFSDRAGRFDYNGDPLSGLWSVWRLDRRNGERLPVVTGAGSASRPLLSPDRKRLVFVSRDRSQALLEVLDLATGRRRVLADWLDRDEMEAFALHGTYPAMDWTDAGELVLWAKGKLWRLAMDGKRTEIPFHAKGTWDFRDVQRWARAVPDVVEAKVVRWPTWRQDGAVAFSALGALWLRGADGVVERLSPGTGYAPAWSPDGTQLAWTSWSDRDGGQLHVTRLGKKRSDEVLPLAGQLANPAWSADGTRLVVLRGVGGDALPDLANEPWYEIVVATREKKGWTTRIVTSTANRGINRATKLWLHEDRVWFMEDRAQEGRKPPLAVLVSVALDGTDERSHLVLGGAEEVAIAPDFRRVAYKLDHQAYVTALPRWSGEVAVEGALPTQRLTKVVGDWLGWTPDGKHVTWAQGPVLHRKAVAGVGAPAKDTKPDYDAGVEKTAVGLTVPRARPEGAIALTHARVLTMKGDEVLEDATIVIERDRIVSIGGPVPAGAKVIDVTGKTVIPGLVDVHAHLHFSAGDVLPEQEWRYLTALDFGVTTVHDPSASTDLVFTQAERVEAGFEKGPRVYSTGGVLYGALANDGAKTPDEETARDHVRRLQAVGATSVKVYQQSQRARRQWYVQACHELGVLCVPEGGGDLFQNLGMVADGFHAIEHSLPNSPVYADVVSWMAGGKTATSAGTAWTPTLLVAYGGLFGENFFFQKMSPLDDARLLRHFPRRALDALAWRRGVLAQDTSWNFQSVARDAARVARAGGLVTLGAHGQLQGLGVHWELWSLASEGAMTPMEALRAATIGGATYIGLEQHLGTVEAGKLADLVVLDADPREDVRNTTKIGFVIKNGEIWP